MRHCESAEFIYILNEYKGYIWDFWLFWAEWYKRDKINELWQIYMAKCASAGIDKAQLPDYAQLLQEMKHGKKPNETPEEVKARIINRLNGGK